MSVPGIIFFPVSPPFSGNIPPPIGKNRLRPSVSSLSAGLQENTDQEPDRPEIFYTLPAETRPEHTVKFLHFNTETLINQRFTPSRCPGISRPEIFYTFSGSPAGNRQNHTGDFLHNTGEKLHTIPEIFYITDRRFST